MLLDNVKPLPLIDVVKSYYGRLPMAVGTGSEHSMAEMLLRHLGLRDYFDAIVGADDVTKHKPEPETFYAVRSCSVYVQISALSSKMLILV